MDPATNDINIYDTRQNCEIRFSMATPTLVLPYRILEPKTRIEVHGLESAAGASLNGANGRIYGFNADTARYVTGVTLPSVKGNHSAKRKSEVKVMNLKPENVSG